MTPRDPGVLVPRLARGHRLQYDRTRDIWLIQAPEKAFVAEGTATEILRRIDGFRSVDAIIDDLARGFETPRDVIAHDVGAMLDDLARRKVLVLMRPDGQSPT